MKKFLVGAVIIFLTILILFSMLGANEVSGQNRDYGINTEFDPMYQTWVPYKLTISILFSPCEGAEIWIKIPEETEVRLVGHSYDKVGFVQAIEKDPGVYIGEFWLEHTESTPFSTSHKGIIKSANIGIGCYGQEPTFLEIKDVGILMPTMLVYLPIIFH